MPDPYWEQVRKDIEGRRTRARGPRGSLVESGGNHFGRTVSRAKGNTEQYWCPTCKAKQLETKLARSRSQRVRCRGCGLIIYPVKESAVIPEVKTCQKCWGYLGTRNKTGFCINCAPDHLYPER